MKHKISARLERLEHHLGNAPDLPAELAQHGDRLWSAPGYRAYARDTSDGARLAVVGPHGAVTYEVAGVTLGDLR